jgi:DNA-binding transcriptional ArsR family regulator
MDDEVAQVLDTLGDEQARRVLLELADDSCSAKQLSDRLNTSLPTIYRRIEELRKLDLLGSKTVVADDGNHFEEYECTFDSTLISLEDDAYDVQIFRK